MFEKFYRMMNELTLDLKDRIDELERSLCALKKYPGSVDEDIKNTMDELIITKELRQFVCATDESMMYHYFCHFANQLDNLEHDFEKHLNSLYNKRAMVYFMKNTNPVKCYQWKKGAPPITEENFEENQYKVFLAIVEYPLDGVGVSYNLIFPCRNTENGKLGYTAMYSDDVIYSSCVLAHTALPFTSDVLNLEM